MPKAVPAENVARNFRRVVPAMLVRYYRRGQRLLKRNPTDADLHRFRIRTKRVRYTLELYADIFPARDALERFRKTQDLLGRLQDCQKLCGFLKGQAARGKWAGHWGDVLRAARKQRKSLRKEFFREWPRLQGEPFRSRLLERIKRPVR